LGGLEWAIALFPAISQLALRGLRNNSDSLPNQGRRYRRPAQLQRVRE
jgi:hypothetical protein